MYSQKRKIIKKPANIVDNMKCIGNNIIGQDNTIIEITNTLWYLTKFNHKKLYDIMLYGNSSLGKTELVPEIAKYFFDNNFFLKSISQCSKIIIMPIIFLGNIQIKKNLGYDLLERESNLIFLDEIDKCPEYFYSAFYSLFDNSIFKDGNYDADVSGTIIVMTLIF